MPTDSLAAIGSEPARSASDRTGTSEVACSYLDFNSPNGTALFFDTGQDFTQYGNGGEMTTTIKVAGYRAFSVPNAGGAACTVAVDTAPAQSLSTTTIGSYDDPVQQLCDRAAQFAATAIEALTST